MPVPSRAAAMGSTGAVLHESCARLVAKMFKFWAKRLLYRWELGTRAAGTTVRKPGMLTKGRRRRLVRAMRQSWELVARGCVCGRMVAWSRGGSMETVMILLVEDLLLLDFEQALVGVGFAVLAVVSGKKALKILSDAATTIQGIVTDKRFQEAPDGWDVARFSREVDPEMPVV